MNIRVEPGSYVIAVSGGVDSVALLHRLQQQPGVRLTVAHFDHGIREDSEEDRLFVQELADSYGLPYVYDEGKLGPMASEAAARQARYIFLSEAAKANGAQAIITAHHQDDVLETAIINLMRGTGRKGLSSLGSREGILRPATNITKQAIIDYANDQGLVWREDQTNKDNKYLRNYVRQNITSRLDDNSKQLLIGIINENREINLLIDAMLKEEMSKNETDNKIGRQWFIELPHDVSKEVMAAWLRSRGVNNFDSKALERLVLASKTGKPNSSYDAVSGARLFVNSDDLALEYHER